MYGKILSQKLCVKYGPNLKSSGVKTEGLLYHSKARPIWLIHGLFYGKKIPLRKFTEKFPKNCFHDICPKLSPEGFMLIFDFSEKFTEHSPITFREISFHELR